MVGIDAGSAVLALDNFLCRGRVREVFHRIRHVQQGLERLGFRAVEVDGGAENSEPPSILQAS